MKTQPAGQPDSRNIPQTSVRNQRPSRGGGWSEDVVQIGPRPSLLSSFSGESQ